MAATVDYLKEASNQTYDSDALEYISGTEVKKGILEAAKWTVSAGAIAGAMAEERMDYDWKQQLVDQYAQFGSSLTEAQVNDIVSATQINDNEEHWLEILNQSLFTVVLRIPRGQAEWEADYAALKDNLDSISPSITQKFLNPALIDAGPSNMRIAVAIRLVNQYAADYRGYDLNQYLNPDDGYVRLVEHLMNEQHELAAHLYGLYLKEAEDWFKANKAYDGQWDNLPQEFRDALLITFVNVGEKAMEKSMAELYVNKGLPYEPQPGMTTSGGMNHLLNAESIGQAIGLDHYGSQLLGSDEGSLGFGGSALIPGDPGLAYRYALLRLRYVALPGLDYSDYNQNGELDLYDPALGSTGQMSVSYIHDRSMMLNELTYLRTLPGNNSYQSRYEDPNGQYSFYDAEQDITVAGASGTPVYAFGDAKGNCLLGTNQADHLYGMGGNDVLEGGRGDDYLEGGAGNDKLFGEDFC